uniref:RNA-polymerase II-associated protein 3-like C-terminal domain-containing protein n=1 Tax=Aureoumbra lagunensis TaxID=44058 RepID=A0A7S3JX94_9STRA|mmetsp:Transcript_1401/g.1829  ORF Transcript_1401/g.1829 Transcript_1401/m.1829 type:complete len:280 (+) Transcript_1401:119-958(+)
MEKVAKVQHQIRNDALEQQEYLQRMSEWEKDIERRDREIQRQKIKPEVTKEKAKVAPIRGTGLRVGISDTKGIENKKKESAAQHTYDKGYGKWESFNVDEALAEIDDTTKINPIESPVKELCAVKQADESIHIRNNERRVSVAPPRDAELAQRELGNDLFAKGDYQGAIRAYTLCLGLKKRNVLALSNRAMAYLKLKEFHNAEIDCTSALNLDPNHLKSLQRRASARDALGKHRAALLDMERALAIQPSSKALLQQQASIRRHLTSCIKNAPFQPLTLL